MVLWWYVSTSGTPIEISKEVTVELRGLPTEYVRTSDIVSKLDIRILGPGALVNNLKDEDLLYVIDLSQVQPGPLTYRIYAGQIQGIPGGVRVTEISPSQINLVIEERMEAKKPVIVETRGKPGHGFVVGAKSADPQFVKVSGPSSEMGLIDGVYTEALDISGADKTVEKDANLEMVGMHLEAVGVGKVRVRIEIKPEEMVKEFRELPVKVENTDLEAVVDPPKLKFELRGPMLDMENLQSESIALTVDATGLKPGKYVLKPVVKTPGGIMAAGNGLPQVKVTLREKKARH